MSILINYLICVLSFKIILAKTYYPLSPDMCILHVAVLMLMISNKTVKLQLTLLSMAFIIPYNRKQ